MSEKGEKEKNSGKQTADEYYDDRLSRDSQLDDNLKSLVSSRPASTTFGHLSTDLDTVSGEEDDTHLVDEFCGEDYRSTGDRENDNSSPVDKSSDILTPDEMGAMMGDWKDTDIPSPEAGAQKRQASTSPGQGVSDASLLSVDMPVRHDPKRIAMAERQVVRVVRTAPAATAADVLALQEQLSDVSALKQQLTSAIQDVVNLKLAMDEQFDTITRTATAVGSHGVAIGNLQEQADIFRKKLVDMEVRTDTTCADVAEAKQVAKKSETVAKKSLEVAQACKADMKALESRVAALRKIQDDMVLNVSRIQSHPTEQQASLPARSDEASENSIFLAGIPSIRDRLRLPRTADPVFVVSCFLRELEIYSGMDSIVIADNAAQTRSAARAVIIHMRSNFHKRGAIGTLRRELARQKMPDTAVRDCFPTATMDKVKRYIRFAMKLKTAGTIDKFQIVNRRGQPILQTGKRNGTYADYDGEVEEQDQIEAEPEKDDGPWTTVGKKGKKSGSVTAPVQQQTDAGQPTAGGATAQTSRWAQQTEEDFPELPAAKNVTSKAPVQNKQKQQLPAESSIQAQRRMSTTVATPNSRNQRQQEETGKPRSHHSSRGPSRNSSRQSSRDRDAARNNDRPRNSSNRGSRATSPLPRMSPAKHQFRTSKSNSCLQKAAFKRKGGCRPQLPPRTAKISDSRRKLANPGVTIAAEAPAGTPAGNPAGTAMQHATTTGRATAATAAAGLRPRCHSAVTSKDMCRTLMRV
jgi:hypothetical protein